MKRREFLLRCSRATVMAGACGLSGLGCRSTADRPAVPRFQTRGVVLIPEDLSLSDWPERAAQAGLTTVALHHQNSPQAVVNCVRSDRGQAFLEKCRRLGLQTEYELHAMRELLPRELFSKDRRLFRMNEQGERVSDANCCVHSPQALEIIAENAVRIARQLPPSTGRYFFWGDDGQPWCRCPQCRPLSDSDQAVLLENNLLKALRRVDATASLAHLAYVNTLPAPMQVRPDAGVFLEYAPIRRRYDIPYAEQAGSDTADGLSMLEANFGIFPRHTAQVLEYWLDVSRFSGWKRPGVKLPWNRQVLLADLETYARLGVRHVTTFAAWVDGDYVKSHGEPTFIAEYGQALAQINRPRSR